MVPNSYWNTILEYDDYSWADGGSVSGEERLSGGVSMDDVPGAMPASIPRWLLPREPYLRVPEALYSEYAILSSAPLKSASTATGRRSSRGPQNKQRDAPDELRDGPAARTSQVISVLGLPERGDSWLAFSFPGA